MMDGKDTERTDSLGSPSSSLCMLVSLSHRVAVLRRVSAVPAEAFSISATLARLEWADSREDLDCSGAWLVVLHTISSGMQLR